MINVTQWKQWLYPSNPVKWNATNNNNNNTAKNVCVFILLAMSAAINWHEKRRSQKFISCCDDPKTYKRNENNKRMHWNAFSINGNGFVPDLLWNARWIVQNYKFSYAIATLAGLSFYYSPCECAFANAIFVVKWILEKATRSRNPERSK